MLPEGPGFWLAYPPKHAMAQGDQLSGDTLSKELDYKKESKL
jgi:hypothetical protein